MEKVKEVAIMSKRAKALMCIVTCMAMLMTTVVFMNPEYSQAASMKALKIARPHYQKTFPKNAGVGKAQDYTYKRKTVTERFDARQKVIHGVSRAEFYVMEKYIGKKWKPADYAIGKLSDWEKKEFKKYLKSAKGKKVYLDRTIYYKKNKKSYKVTSSQGCQKEVWKFYYWKNGKKKVMATRTMWKYQCGI